MIDVCEDPELTQEEKTVSAFIIFYDGINDYEDIIDVFGNDAEEAMKAMMKFISYNYDDELASSAKVKLIDWVQDESLIVSGVNGVAKTEIRELKYLHWWTFLSYYMAIGDGPLATV